MLSKKLKEERNTAQKKSLFQFFLGANQVIISTWSRDVSFNLDNFSLKSMFPSRGIYGILCEKGKHTT